MADRKTNPAILILLVLLIATVLWFFTQTPSSSSEKSLPAKIAASGPDQAVVLAKIVAPPAARAKIDPIAVPATLPADAATPDHADPQAELKTAIPEIVRLWREGKIVELRLTYNPPGRISPEMIQILQVMQRENDDIIAAHPDLQQTYHDAMEANAKPYEELEGQIPLYNAAGDEATYQLRQEDGTYASRTFVKINGKWYLEEN